MTHCGDDKGAASPPAKSLTDGRGMGQFESHYPSSAWMQIWIEFAYLLAMLVFSLLVLLRLSFDIESHDPSGKVLYFFKYPETRRTLIWLAVGLSAVVGGALYALKWLYHTVAWKMWHRDRVLWRITVPVISGAIAPFFAFMVATGVVPFFSTKVFDGFQIACAFGFFIGLFSDNALAALQRLSQRIFGTVSGSRSTNGAGGRGAD